MIFVIAFSVLGVRIVSASITSLTNVRRISIALREMRAVGRENWRMAVVA